MTPKITEKVTPQNRAIFDPKIKVWRLCHFWGFSEVNLQRAERCKLARSVELTEREPQKNPPKMTQAPYFYFWIKNDPIFGGVAFQ